MPYPGWLGDSTLGDLGGGGGGFPPTPPTLSNLGSVPQGPVDPFADRFGQWQPARSPAGLPAWEPATPSAVPNQPGYMGPPRFEELQAPPAAPTALANAPPFWQRFLGAIGEGGYRTPARIAAIPTPQFGGGPRFGAVGRGNVRGI